MTSTLTCSSHLSFHFGQFFGLSNQLINDLIEALRDRVHAGMCLLVRFGEVDLVSVNGLVAGQAGDCEDSFAASGNVKPLYPTRERSVAVRADVVNQPFGSGAKHCAGRSRRSCVNGLGLFVDLSHRFGHLLMGENAFAVRPNGLSVAEQRDFSAMHATKKRELLRIVELAEVKKPDLLSANHEGVFGPVLDKALIGLLEFQDIKRVGNHSRTAVRALD